MFYNKVINLSRLKIMKSNKEDLMGKAELLTDFLVDSSVVEIESLGEVTIKIKW